MNVTQHKSVLNALAYRSQTFRNRNCLDAGQAEHLWSVDKTGTIDTSALALCNLRDTEQQEIREINSIQVPDEILRVHGMAPPTKAEGSIRMVYENVNGFQNKMFGNEKVDKAKDLHDELEVDIAAYCEHRLNMRHKRNQNRFSQLFKGGEAAVRSVVAHNVHENFGPVQEGGTSLLLFGPLAESLLQGGMEKDTTGLGRWVVMTLEGQGAKTRIVCGYNPCGNNKPNSGTTFQQHQRYFITQEKKVACPRAKFREDLVAQLKKWRAEGDRIVVCMDANEDIYRKSLGKALTDQEGLNMSEAVGDFTGKKLGATFFRGTKPIDGVWATKDITITHACVMPAGYGMGDHRMFVVDMLEESLIGQAPFRVIRGVS